MKLPKELFNAIIIAGGIAIYFFIMEFFGLTNLLYLRILNGLIVFYGVNRTLKSNFEEKKEGYVANLQSAGLTAFLGVILSIVGLVIYIYAKGGDSYVNTLSEDFLFGGKPTANVYWIGVLFEGLASGVIIVFVAMQLWRSKLSSQD